MEILTLEIPVEKRDQFLDDLVLIEQVSEQFGKDITHMFAQICLLYDIKEEEDLQKLDKTLVRNHCVNILKIISHAIQEIDGLRSHDNIENAIVIPGDNYKYIFMMINNMKSYYLSLLDLICDKMYLSHDFIEEIHKRLRFLISTDYEALRTRFKIIETARLNLEKSSFSSLKTTIH